MLSYHNTNGRINKLIYDVHSKCAELTGRKYRKDPLISVSRPRNTDPPPLNVIESNGLLAVHNPYPHMDFKTKIQRNKKEATKRSGNATYFSVLVSIGQQTTAKSLILTQIMDILAILLEPMFWIGLLLIGLFALYRWAILIFQLPRSLISNLT